MMISREDYRAGQRAASEIVKFCHEKHAHFSLEQTSGRHIGIARGYGIPLNPQ